MEVSAEDFPRLVFIDNKNDVRLCMNIESSINTARELFEFLVDILVKGIVLLYGDETSRVDLGKLGPKELSVISQKLANAGITLLVDVNDQDVKLPPGVAFEIKQGCSEDSLESYRLRIADAANKTTRVGFSLLRVVAR